MAEIFQYLISARQKIEDPKNWCYGKMRIGEKFCAVGAIHFTLAALKVSEVDTMNALRVACNQLYKTASIPQVNDQKGHEAILKCFDLAISTELKKYMVVVFENGGINIQK